MPTAKWQFKFIQNKNIIQMMRVVSSLFVFLGLLFVASGAWLSIASDTSGRYLVASSTYLYTSSDYGTTWVPGISSISWQGVASDASGKIWRQ
jgi:hypothetical protein